MSVRTATTDDLLDVMNVLDGAMLAVEAATVRDRIIDDDVLVAVTADGKRILGVLVLDGTQIDAVAVRRRRRGQGFGTALVETAATRRTRLTATFDTDISEFYDRLGFVIESTDEPDRLRGQLE